MKKNNFEFIMISAMYENGGNTLQRHLDGHPELFVYPYESQPGTTKVQDYLTSLFPQKYRWPEFGLEGMFDTDYEQIIDEEFKVRVNTPHVSKFREVSDLGCTNNDRKKIFLTLLKDKERTRANIIEAFFRSSFLAWKTRTASKKEHIYVGYSPIIGVDAEKIIHDFPKSVVLHIVRNPYAAYAETKRRPVPYSLQRYIQTWNIVQLMMLNFATTYPKNVYIVRYEDLVKDKQSFFQDLTKKLSISYSDSLLYSSWNSNSLSHQYPWGTIEIPTQQAHENTTKELTHEEYLSIKNQSVIVNKALGYEAI